MINIAHQGPVIVSIYELNYNKERMHNNISIWVHCPVITTLEACTGPWHLEALNHQDCLKNPSFAILTNLPYLLHFSTILSDLSVSFVYNIEFVGSFVHTSSKSAHGHFWATLI